MVAKKSVAKEGISAPEKVRVPGGFGRGISGSMRSPEYVANLYAQREAKIKAELKAQKAREAKDRKNAKLREKRQRVRDERRAALGQAKQGVNRTLLNKRLKGWASTSSSRLRNTTSYHWHAVITVTGTSAQLGKAAQLAGSENVKFVKVGDDLYTAIFVPGVGAGTPGFAADASSGFAASGEAWAEKFRAEGATAEYHGLMYNNVRTEEFKE